MQIVQWPEQNISIALNNRQNISDLLISVAYLYENS